MAIYLYEQASLWDLLGFIKLLQQNLNAYFEEDPARAVVMGIHKAEKVFVRINGS